MSEEAARADGLHKGGVHFLDRMEPQGVVHLPQTKIFENNGSLMTWLLRESSQAKQSLFLYHSHLWLSDSTVQETPGNLRSPWDVSALFTVQVETRDLGGGKPGQESSPFLVEFSGRKDGKPY